MMARQEGVFIVKCLFVELAGSHRRVENVSLRAIQEKLKVCYLCLTYRSVNGTMHSTDGLYAHSVKFFVFHAAGTFAGWSIETRDESWTSLETDPVGPALFATNSDAFSINSLTI